MAFFALAISGCVGFVVFCTLHPTDLVAPDYYEREPALPRPNPADGPSPGPSHDRLATTPPTQRIQISFPAELMRSGVSGSIQLYRPSAAGLDRQLNLEPDATGVQTIDAQWPAGRASGKSRPSWKAGTEEFYIDRKVGGRQTMMELWTAFILGLVGSLHCAGMCGPLALALPPCRPLRNPFRLGTRPLTMPAGSSPIARWDSSFGLAGRTLLLAGIQRWVVDRPWGALLLVGLFASRKLALWRPITTLVEQVKTRMAGLLRPPLAPLPGAAGPAQWPAPLWPGLCRLRRAPPLPEAPWRAYNTWPPSVWAPSQ